MPSLLCVFNLLLLQLLLFLLLLLQLLTLNVVVRQPPHRPSTLRQLRNLASPIRKV
jgi:hypothetical protein